MDFVVDRRYKIKESVDKAVYVVLAILVLIIVECIIAAKKTSEKNNQFSQKLKSIEFTESKRIESGGNVLL